MEAPAARPWITAMEAALVEARACLATGDVPVGAVVVDAGGVVVATGRNEREAIYNVLRQAVPEFRGEAA